MSKKTISIKLIYKILIYLSLEVIEHIQEAIIDVIINNLFPSTSTNYVICATSKAIYIISRKTNNKEVFLKTEAVFTYNIIYKKKAYNRNIFCSHL